MIKYINLLNIEKYLYQLLHTRRVKIIKCDNPFSWYYKEIGSSFIVERVKKKDWMIGDDWKTEYITINYFGNSSRGYIKKSDVIVSFNF